MMKSTAAPNAMRDYSSFDERSVDFSVDPDMYTKLDIKKAKMGEENPFDVQKIYQFQLDKDIKKMTKQKGTYEQRNGRFLAIRAMDEEYKRVAIPAGIATHGNFKEILEYTTEESWKATSRPYGEQAHKRYLDYVANIPKGPSEEEVRDKLQRKMDKELWENIITGKLELTKKEEKQRLQRENDLLEAQILEKNELEHVKKRRLWKQHIGNDDFHELRHRPTEREYLSSLDRWNKGIHYPYDMEEIGIPNVAVDTLLGTELIKERNKDESIAPEMKFSSEQYIAGNDGAEKDYLQHMIGINLGKVDKYLKKRRKDIVKEQQLAEELKQIREKQRRRAARVERHNLADDIITAKFTTIQDKNQKIKKIKSKKPGMLDVEKQEQQNIEESDDGWSEDSSGIFGSPGKTGEGKEGENGDDADIGAGYQRQHTSINIADILKLNEVMSGSPKKKPTAIPIPAPSTGVNAEPERVERRKISKNPRAGKELSEKITKDRRGNITSLPALVGESISEKLNSNDNEGEGVKDVGSEGEGETRENDADNVEYIEKTEEKDEDGEGLEGFDDDANGPAQFKNEWDDKDHASEKYSTKYKNWSFSGKVNVPDYIKNTIFFNNNGSAKVAPNAYAVKNYKQRNIVFRVIIHYAKKVHPRRLIFLAGKAYRRVKKYYKQHFTNPDNLTRSEREKNATLHKLDILTQDASSSEYLKTIVNLADHEIPSEEYLKFAKRKQRKFKEEISRLEEKGHLDSDEKKELEMLKRRLELHDEVYNERLQREQKAKRKTGLIKRYIADTRSLVEATSNFSMLDRWRIHYRIMKQDMVQRAVELKNNKTQEHMLPEFDKNSNDEIIKAMYDARQLDQQKSAWKRKWRRRWNYVITGNKAFLEDEELKVRDVDDLILAARAGNYVEVMDIIMHPTNPVSPNCLNEDGITATYATLMMILKREVLDSEADLAQLGLSKLERIWKAIKPKKKGTEPKLDLVLRALLYCGGKVDFQKIEAGVDGSAAMHSAAELGALDMIDWLLKKGTDINLRTAMQQKTPLMVALEHNQLEVVDLLLKRGVMMHLQLKDANGWTALHYAASFARLELSVILMTCGAHTNIRNNAGRLASEEARARGRTEIATTIMTFKSDVVVVRTRIENLMNRTDAHYRKHRQKVHINQRVRDGPAVARPGLQATSLRSNTLRLPPIQPRGSSVSVANPSGFDTDEAEDENHEVQNQEQTAEDEDDYLPGALEEKRKKEAAAAAAAEAKEREQYERRMSSIVAAADPWNLAPHTKPRPNRLAKMSFYSKPKGGVSTK